MWEELVVKMEAPNQIALISGMTMWLSETALPHQCLQSSIGSIR